ncbi:MAG: Type 1 glutamine amidotransferase-like domain-containing protein [Acidobacteria bacterium]|nr:Type 1 glutamine amidotransferase-like domain-containing protein [Acidobacteriota bacterium]
MHGPLALVGGGEFTPGCSFDAELLAAVQATEVVLLPTGSAYENPGRLVAAAQAWFAGLGVDVRALPVHTRPDAFVAENIEAVAAARMIYLAGASPMHLRSVLSNTPLLDAIREAWRGGAALVGTSAGADVLCDPMVDQRGGAYTVGLGLLPGLAVIPQADTWSKEKVHRTVELAPADVVVVELPERTAIVLDAGQGWRRAGVGEVVVHTGRGIGSLTDVPQPSR